MVILSSVCTVMTIAPVLIGSAHPESFYVRLSPSSHQRALPDDEVSAQLLKDVARLRSRQSVTPTYSGHSVVKLTTQRETDASSGREKDNEYTGRRGGKIDRGIVAEEFPHRDDSKGEAPGRVDGGKKLQIGDAINGRNLNRSEETRTLSGEKNNSFVLHVSNETDVVGVDADNDTKNDPLETWEEAGENDMSNIFDILHDLSRIQFTWIDIILTALCTVAVVLLCVNVAILVRYCRKHRQFSPVFTATSSGGRQNPCQFNDSLQIHNEKMLCRRACLGWGNCRKFTANVALPGTLSPVVSIGNSSVDHMIANFVSDELIGELNDRDSACTSISDGFVFSRSYGSERSYNTAATIL